MKDIELKDDAVPVRFEDMSPEMLEKILKGIEEYDAHNDRVERVREQLCGLLDEATADQLAAACSWDPTIFKEERISRLTGLERLVALARSSNA